MSRFTPNAEQMLSAFGQEIDTWRATPVPLLGVLANETRKGLFIVWAHPASIILAIVTMSFFYLGVQFIIGQGQLARDLLPRTLVAFGPYLFLYFASLVMVSDLVEEMRTGTLGQALLSPAPPSLLVLGRLATASVQGVLVAALGTAVPLMAVGIPIAAHWEALVPLALAFVDGLAFTLLLAGIALREPFIGEVHHLVVGLVGFLNGAYLPVALFPDWLEPIARLLPTTLGIEATLKILFEHRSLGDLWADGSLPWLLGYTFALAALGCLVFARNQQEALRDGAIG